jgi:HK97 family phage prohead protease
MTAPLNTRDIAYQPILRASEPLEIKLAGGREGLIEGLASPYGGPPDLYNDVIARSAYSATIAEHKSSGVALPLLWAHDLAKPVGRCLDLWDDERGLFVKAQLNLETSSGKDAFAHLQAKDVTGLSIGFRVPEGGYRYQKDGTRLILAVDLVEISVVTVPAARRARVTEVKSVEDLKDQRDLERLLHEDAGLSRRAAKAVAARGWGGISGEDEKRAAAELLRRMDQTLEEIRSVEMHPHYYR